MLQRWGFDGEIGFMHGFLQTGHFHSTASSTFEACNKPEMSTPF